MVNVPSVTTLIAIFFFSLPCPKAIAQHNSWINYSINNGLPNNEVYDMIQDSHGFMWFATSQGICRFNGYEFQRPVDTSALVNNSVFKIEEDFQGRIWFNHIDGAMSFVENDTVKRWKYNDTIRLYAGEYRNFGSFVHERDGTLWLPLLGLGILVIRPDGMHSIIGNADTAKLILSEIAGKMLCSVFFEPGLPPQRLRKEHKLSVEFSIWKEGKEISLGQFPNNNSFEDENGKFDARKLGKDDILIEYGYTYYLIRNNRLLWHGRKDFFANDIYEDADGSILVSVTIGKEPGLLRFESLNHFMRDSFAVLLPGRQVSKMLRDREGGWWAITIDEGIYYCQNPGLQVMDVSSGLPSGNVIQITSDGADMFYAGILPSDVFSIDRRSGKVHSLSGLSVIGNEVNELQYDPWMKRLWAGQIMTYWSENKWHLPANFNTGQNNYPIKFPIKRISPSPDNRTWLASSTYGFYRIDPIAGTFEKIPLDAISKRTFAASQSKDGTIWVTTQDGLKIWKNNRYEPAPFFHPAMRFPARTVQWLPDTLGGGIVLTLRGGGILFRDKSGKCCSLTTRTGLTSDIISDIIVDTTGVIYACSNAGLNILTREKDGHWNIQTLSVKHGLPSNQVNDVSWIGNELWVATNKGIVRFSKRPNPAPMPAPVLEKFAVNNQSWNWQDGIKLAHDYNNILLKFFSLHFRSNGDILYRYWLVGADTAFTYTHNREVRFAELAPGTYTFEVQAQNEDRQWSEASRWAFTICPPWWATWWFQCLSVAFLIAGLYFFYRKQLESSQIKAAEQEKIRELEMTALRAQMNPHFIFNCLQAIQAFIAKNDKDAAATYLARFAKLVRLALHSSVDGRHPLTEEIAMLENYLHLEQIRFRGSFEFLVHLEKGLNAEEISLPPLLVQPFVENALLHGLQTKSSGGFIEVLFALKDKLLEVTVRDNGPGFSEESGYQQGKHKSVGMMLTQKRLDLLKATDADTIESMIRKSILNEQGMAVGAQVQLLIPIS